MNGIYLCQVSPHVSCGACCGLYNVEDPSPENLTAMLTRRTRWFAGVPRTVAGIDAFKARVEDSESQIRPFPDFHHCSFLGMIEDEGRRVGCLLHPLAAGNDGLDWRGLSFYGGMACRTYFCPSVKQLPSRWLKAIRQCMTGWYLHGLVVTERRLLAAFFSALEARLGRTIRSADFNGSRPAAALSKSLAFLKLEWPCRRQEAPGVCNYFFEDGLYARPAVERPPAAAQSRYAAIFRELDAGFHTAADLFAAEAALDALIDELAAVLQDG